MLSLMQHGNWMLLCEGRLFIACVTVAGIYGMIDSNYLPGLQEIGEDDFLLR